MPVNHVMSLAPNKGKMRIKCVDELGNAQYSDEFYSHYSDASISRRIM